MIDKGWWPVAVLIGLLILLLGFTGGVRVGVATSDAAGMRAEAVGRGLAVWELDNHGKPTWRWRTDAELRDKFHVEPQWVFYDGSSINPDSQ